MTPSTRPTLPQRLPASLTYNDLNGDEAAEILVTGSGSCSRPLPDAAAPDAAYGRARPSVQVGVDMYVGGTVPVASPPDHIDINGSAIKLTNEMPVDWNVYGYLS